MLKEKGGTNRPPLEGALRARRAAGEGGYEFGNVGQQNKNFVDLRGGKMAPLPGFAGFQALGAYGAPGPAPFLLLHDLITCD